MFNKIAVICTGNICRSPMAEGLLAARLREKGGKERLVISAGIGALVGNPADPIAIEVMRDHGLDITGHRAQQATMGVLSSMDLVLTLDRTHSDWLNRQYPQLRGRVHKILKWQNDRDVEDPYRHPRAAFEQSYRDIESGLADWLKHL